MRYITFTVTLFIFSLISKAQEEFVKDIGDKACECIQQSEAVNADSCITKASASVMAESKNSLRKIRKLFEDGTMQKIFKESQVYINQHCEYFQEAIKKSVVNSNYLRSSIDLANQHYVKGTTKMKLGEFNDAIIELREAILLDSTFIEALDHLGYCHRNLNENDSAIYYYKKSIKLNPEGEVALVNIGIAYSQESEHSESIKYYDKLIEINPNDPEGFFGKAREQMYLDQIYESANNAFRVYKMYEALNSSYLEDAENLIFVLYKKFEKQNRTGEFIEMADKWNIKIHPD